MKIHARYLESPSLLLRLDVRKTFPLLNANMNAILCLSHANTASCQEMNLNSLMIVVLSRMIYLDFALAAIGEFDN